MKICHLTSVHGQEDVRIFHKECTSLAKAGYDVYLISVGKTYDKNGVHIIGIGKPKSTRFGRILKSSKDVYQAAVKLDADIYHFHDPELLHCGLKLKKSGKKVIFDSHEDVPSQIMYKTWIPRFLRKFISVIYRMYETHVVQQLDAVVAATPHIAELFKGRCNRIVVINNYPKLDDIKFHDKHFSERESIICYAGTINDVRGEKVMIDAMRDMDATLVIAGDHQVMEIEGVRYVGQLNRKDINKLYGQAIVGLCILKPVENYYYSQPIKIYEYMASGLPYICSDFPSWREVAEESEAGICININDIENIRDVIRMLLTNREKAQSMGRKGREYVINKCNWCNEEKSLLSLYQSIT